MCCSVLQCAAMCCRVLQCVAVCCHVLQVLLQRVAVHPVAKYTSTVSAAAVDRKLSNVSNVGHVSKVSNLSNISVSASHDSVMSVIFQKCE